MLLPKRYEHIGIKEEKIDTENNKKLNIFTKKVKTQKINDIGNIEDYIVEKKTIGYEKEILSIKNEIDILEFNRKRFQLNELNLKITSLSNYYLYLEQIDDDTYIYGDLSCNPAAINYPELYDDIDAHIKYGILKLKRDETGKIIPMQEEIIVQNIFDRISKNNSKTVTVYFNDDMAYFDYEKKVLLTPVVLKHAVPFNVEYKGFAECSTKNQEGYLPRDAKPVTKEENIKLLTKQQVECLTDFQENLGQVSLTREFVDADVIYKEITGHSYTMKEKDK